LTESVGGKPSARRDPKLPFAEADSVSIITMHLAKGLEWPIVIPINSPTELYDDTTFLHRRSDDTAHFKILDQAPADYELVKAAERDQVRRERARRWYVAITRACDLLLLPRQSERKNNDWMSIVDLTTDIRSQDDRVCPRRSRCRRAAQCPG
jgi:ATP-dependent exoDNAse (exonuclease V) beta subunit